MKIKIDKDIPIQYNYTSIYPFHKLEVGYSFLLPKSVNRKTVRSSVSKYSQKHKMKFITRSVEGGTRVWRIK